MEFLTYCQGEAIRRGRAQLASVSLGVRHIDPLAVLESIYEEEHLHFYLERPQAGEAVAGAEAVLQKTFQGPERFAGVKAFANEVLENTLAVGDCHLPLAGPLFFCTFAFDENDDSLDFPPARVFVPRWQVARRGDAFVAVANILVDEDSELEPLARRVMGAHHKFSRFDYGISALAGGPPPVRQTQEVFPDGGFVRAVEAALGRIRAGAYQKIVLARALDLLADGAFTPFETVNALRERFGGCHCFSVSNGFGGSFIGASPERLVTVSGTQLTTEALAGSAPRGKGASEDARLARGLLQSDKDLREHGHVVESIVSRLESLGLSPVYPQRPALLQLANVQHLRTPISAPMPPGQHLLDVAHALHPTPAVGGRPRDAALADIRALEPFSRSLFTGLLGWFNAHSEGELVVALRSGYFRGNRARLYAGAGVVPGSDAIREQEETELKLKAMLNAITPGGAAG